MSRSRVDAMQAIPSQPVLKHRERVIELAARHRIPAMYWFDVFVNLGGLMSYGIDWTDLYRRSADYVVKIFKGAKPGDLPIEQPSKFELLINLKTAKTLGLMIPPSMLLRADRVIESPVSAAAPPRRASFSPRLPSLQPTETRAPSPLRLTASKGLKVAARK